MILVASWRRLENFILEHQCTNYFSRSFRNVICKLQFWTDLASIYFCIYLIDFPQINCDSMFSVFVIQVPHLSHICNVTTIFLGDFLGSYFPTSGLSAEFYSEKASMQCCTMSIIYLLVLRQEGSTLTFLQRRSLSRRNQSTDLQSRVVQSRTWFRRKRRFTNNGKAMIDLQAKSTLSFVRK